MGGKKGPEKNRNYEKNRRDRFNSQVIELSKLLPDFNSSMIKVTKAEIIGRTIRYLQDTIIKHKKLEDASEKEKNQIEELKKRTASLLEIIQELITLLRKFDVNFPKSLPSDDFASFIEAYKKCKRKFLENAENEGCKKTKLDLCDSTDPNSKSSTKPLESSTTKSNSVSTSTDTTSLETVRDIVSYTTTTGVSSLNSVSTSKSIDPPKSINTTVMNLQTPNVLRLDSNSLILPSANILTVNGLQNTVISPMNNSQTLLVNKPITVPTLILMQSSNVLPVCSVQQVTVSQQRSQKLIVPKQSTISTKTTFINKKPIPTVCLYNSSTSEKETSSNKSPNYVQAKSKKSKKSKGILVEYPKRKSPKKKKKTVENQEENEKLTEPPPPPSAQNELRPEKEFTPVERFDNNEKSTSNEDDTFNMVNCYSISENTFNQNDLNKNYSCSENIFDTNDTQNSNEFGAKNVQFIDFFENTSARSVDNSSENVHSIDSSQYLNPSGNTCKKIGKPVENQSGINIDFKRKENYNDHMNICAGNFSNANINCDNLEAGRSKETELKNASKKNDSICANESTNHEKGMNSIYHHLPTSCGVSNDSLLMKYVPNDTTSDSSHNCGKNYSQPVVMGTDFENSLTKGVDKSNPTEENVSSKSKSVDKEIAPLSVRCSVPENKSISKQLSLSLMDEKKHYDNVSSFDEFSNDLFTSLQVPASGQNADSISPTAAFLLTFPLVSSCKNADLLQDHEDENVNAIVTTSTTILQIGSLESPPTLLYTSSKFSSRETQKGSSDKLSFLCSKPDDSYSTGFCNTISNGLVNDLTNSENSTSNSQKDKLRGNCKENDVSKQYAPIRRSDGYNFNDVPFGQKNTCVSKDILPVSQNMPFYTPSCAASTFPSYNIFTKYNDIPPVTASYYSFGSQPFPVSKSVVSDSIGDFNSWAAVPSVYNQENDSLKEKTKRDKCTSTHAFKNKQNDFASNISTFGLPTNELNSSQLDRSKTDKTKKTQKQNNTRLVNWMTSPDLKNTADTTPQSHLLTENYLPQKDDPAGTSTFLNGSSISNVQNNSAFGNVSYASTDYFLDNQNYVDNQNLNNCKVSYSSSANPTSYSWSPSKSTLPTLPHLDTHSMMIPSTLPTLVGDLALGNSNASVPVDKIFNNYDLLPKKCVAETDKTLKRDACHKNYCKNNRISVNNEYVKSNSQSSFLSVTQLVDDKDRSQDDKFTDKNASKSNIKTAITSIGQSNCLFDSDLNREKCNFIRNKENYGAVLKSAENADYSKKTYGNTSANVNPPPCITNATTIDVHPPHGSTLKNNQNSNMKCKSKEPKYNVNRCLAKENKKESRSALNSSHQKPYDYGVQNHTANCDSMLNKGVNPLSNKNSNYSAESLISSSHHQNSCSSQNYFYDNTNYPNCSTNDYARKRIEPETDSSVTNVGYYTNSNYVYPNNFQSFNNYGFSNQCYDNYSSQIQHTGLQKKIQKDDIYNKQDTDWYTPHYNSIVPGDFGSLNKTADKCKQPFAATKCNSVQKNSANNPNGQNSKYYHYHASNLPNNSKASCSFNSSYSFNQSTQQCSEIPCSASNYEMKSNRNTSGVNTNNVHTATSLTNFNLSAIFPEINDKHCNQSRPINTIGNEKKDANYSNNKINMDEMNYNYMIQPSTENNMETVSVFGSSSYQIQHFPDFGNRKLQK